MAALWVTVLPRSRKIITILADVDFPKNVKKLGQNTPRNSNIWAKNKGFAEEKHVKHQRLNNNTVILLQLFIFYGTFSEPIDVYKISSSQCCQHMRQFQGRTSIETLKKRQITIKYTSIYICIMLH